MHVASLSGPTVYCLFSLFSVSSSLVVTAYFVQIIDDDDDMRISVLCRTFQTGF